MTMHLWVIFACGGILAFIASKGLRRINLALGLPPSPPGSLFTGHLHLLKLPLHRSLSKLAQTYGPLFYLNMGFVPTVVVSSAHWAREFLHIHERDFADRPQGEASKRLFYGHKTVVTMEHGPQWRELRKLYTLQMLSMKQVEMFKQTRREEVAMAMELLENKEGVEVEVRKVVFGVVGNMMTRMLLSKRLFDYGDGRSRFGEMVEEMAVLFGAPVIGDLIPCLAWFDCGGYKRRMTRLSLLLDTFLERVLAERLEENNTYCSNTSTNLTSILKPTSNTYTKKVSKLDDKGTHFSSTSDIEDEINSIEEMKSEDFLGLLLDIYKEDEGDKGRECIKGILLDFLSAGTETTMTTIEWAMAELLRNPHCMKKLQVELATVEKLHCPSNEDVDCYMIHTTCDPPSFEYAILEDEAVLKLPYLQAVLKETLRLHPPLPIVVRQMSKHLTHGKKVGGYMFPPRTKLLVNVWALGHDTTTWGEDAHTFNPEKFFNSLNTQDLRGQHYEFLPFGSGRRGCPGMNLGLSMVALVLANFVHFFDWKLPSGYTLDSTEASSRTAPMATPLKAIPYCFKEMNLKVQQAS